MKVVFARQAEAGLARIGDFIAQDNPRRVMTFVTELADDAMALADMPNAFPLVPRYEGLGIRRRVHGAYLILYRVEAARVVILHIVHGATDYGRLLGPKDDAVG
jgi:toxin ParE1/3/4